MRARLRRRADRLRADPAVHGLLPAGERTGAGAEGAADGDDRGAERRRSPRRSRLPPSPRPAWPPSPLTPLRPPSRRRRSAAAEVAAREKSRADARRAAAKPAGAAAEEAPLRLPMTAAGSGFGSAKPMNPVGWLGVADAALPSPRPCCLATPIRIFGFALPEPVFPLVLAFAWAVIRPSVLPPFALLAAGALPRRVLGRAAGALAALPAGRLRRGAGGAPADHRPGLRGRAGSGTARRRRVAFGVGFLLMCDVARRGAEPAARSAGSISPRCPVSLRPPPDRALRGRGRALPMTEPADLLQRGQRAAGGVPPPRLPDGRRGRRGPGGAGRPARLAAAGRGRPLQDALASTTSSSSACSRRRAG